jgi:ubiquinone/menaquinone biosynthesis C-methylase UbiE
MKGTITVIPSHENDNQWSEEASATFIDLAEIFVPLRQEQFDTLVSLLPVRQDEAFTVVELAAGEGLLAEAILERYPNCYYIALDGSEAMRTQMRKRLAPYAQRLEVRPFLLAEQDWRANLPTVRCILCSLSVHHLSTAGKRQLFHDMIRRLEAGGALLLADIVRPANQHIAEVYAQQYDEIVRQQSMRIRGDLSGFEEFQRLEWNYFAYDYYDPNSTDKPSLLSEQLRLMQEVNFSLIDCFWLRAGHAVFGAYK